MKPEIKQRWIAALRSGKYAQTRGLLQDYRGYCCLGVLCDLAEKDGIYIEKKNGEYFSDTTLPISVKSWGDLISHNPSLNYQTNKTEAAAVLNDYWKFTFAEIANFIEATPDSQI